GQPGGIAGCVLAEVTDHGAQPADLGIEDLTEMRQVGVFAQGRQEPRHVVGAGDSVLALDPQEQPQRRIAAEFLEASVDRDVPQGDGQDERAPEDLDGIVIAPLAARRAEGIEQGMVGDRLQEHAEGWKRRRILEGIPGEQRLGNRDLHRGRQRAEGRGDKRPTITTQKIPASLGPWGKIRERTEIWGGKPHIPRASWGKPIPGHASWPRKTRAGEVRNDLSLATFRWIAPHFSYPMGLRRL